MEQIKFLVLLLHCILFSVLMDWIKQKSKWKQQNFEKNKAEHNLDPNNHDFEKLFHARGIADTFKSGWYSIMWFDLTVLSSFFSTVKYASKQTLLCRLRGFREVSKTVLYFLINSKSNRFESNRISTEKRDKHIQTDTLTQYKTKGKPHTTKQMGNVLKCASHHIHNEANAFDAKPALSHIFDQQMRVDEFPHDRSYRGTNTRHTTMNPWWPRPKCRCYFFSSSLFLCLWFP